MDFCKTELPQKTAGIETQGRQVLRRYEIRGEERQQADIERLGDETDIADLCGGAAAAGRSKTAWDGSEHHSPGVRSCDALAG